METMENKWGKKEEQMLSYIFRESITLTQVDFIPHPHLPFTLFSKQQKL